MNVPAREARSPSCDAPLPELIQARNVAGAIQPERPFSYIRQRVREGRIVLLKNAVDAELMLRFRRALMRWSQTHAPFPHGKSPVSIPQENYHRVDDGSIESSLPHVFHQFGLNAIDQLEVAVREPANAVARAMLDVQNEVGETHFDLSSDGLRLKVLHYPAGGGFLAQHVHPLEPQRVGLILSASRLETDVGAGGSYFLSPFGQIDTAAHHDIGDLILFRYDIPHGVLPVAGQRALDWQSEAGKWSVVLDLRETHGRSKIA